MPCMSSDGMGSAYGSDPEARRNVERLTRISCDILGALERAGLNLRGLNEETRDWWTAHKAEDQRRDAARKAQAEREKLREEGLAKLSPEERKALGL